MLRAMRTHTGSYALAACLLAALFTLSGCAYGQMTQVLRTQVASETDCPETKVVKRQVYDGAGENEYEVTGCGESRNYVCPADEGLFSYDEPICTLGADDSKPKLAAMGDDDVLEGTPEIDLSVPEKGAAEEAPAEEAPAEEPKAEEAPAEEPKAEEAPAAEEPKAEAAPAAEEPKAEDAK